MEGRSISASNGNAAIGMVALLAVAAAILIGTAYMFAKSSSDLKTLGDRGRGSSEAPAASSVAGSLPDVKAKSQAIAASQTLEMCAANAEGNYASCSLDQLVEYQPTLAEASDFLSVSTGVDTYTVTVEAAAGGNEFSVVRSADGVTSRSCTEAGTGDCPDAGTW